MPIAVSAVKLSLLVMSACQPLHQVARLRPLAGALYDSTRSSTAPISHARDELGLFLSTLDATETCIVLCSTDCASLPLDKTLSACHRVLEDLQAVHQNPVGDANPSLGEIKARFSSLLFELCRMNVDMSMCVAYNPRIEVGLIMIDCLFLQIIAK